MPEITAVRAGGDLPRDDIIEPLLVTSAAKRERGRVALNDGEDLAEKELLCLGIDGLRLGDFVRVYDHIKGIIWTGRCSAFTHVDRVSGYTTLVTLETPKRQTITT